jgi:hypothetical protein
VELVGDAVRREPVAGALDGVAVGDAVEGRHGAIVARLGRVDAARARLAGLARRLPEDWIVHPSNGRIARSAGTSLSARIEIKANE